MARRFKAFLADLVAYTIIAAAMVVMLSSFFNINILRVLGLL